MTEDKIRLSKLMSERGLCSRREADAFIEKRMVYVNGQLVTELGFKVNRDVSITLDTQALHEQKNQVTIMLNKPVGYVSAQPEPGMTPAIRLITDERQFIDDRKRLKMGDLKNIAVIGRLDVDSQGLLLFTQDGRLAKKVIGENSEIEKEYLVRYEGKLTNEKLKLLCHGLSLDETPLKPAQVTELNDDQLKFILKEGKKRQIRRMCELVDLKVTGLKRVRIGQLKLGPLPEGKWCFVDPQDIL